MKKAPSPMRVIALEGGEDQQSNVQLALEIRAPIANRDQAVLLWIMLLAASSFLIAGLVYKVPGVETLHLVGNLHGGALLTALAVPIFLAIGYWVLYSDRGPGFIQEGYTYKEVKDKARNVLNVPEGQSILAEAIKDIPTMDDGARYLSPQQARELNQRINDLMISQEKKNKQMARERAEEGFATAIIAAGFH